MNGKSRDLKSDTVDSDDAPELTENFFDHAEWSVGKRSVSPAVGVAALTKATFRGGPPMENPKRSTTVRYDDEGI